MSRTPKPGDIPRATIARGTIREQMDTPPPPAKAAPRPERVAAFHTGLSAESRAAAWLIAKGFRILARRWRSPAGEIDIIARRRHLLIFVEVKARDTLDHAAESVTPQQRQRIAAAAEIWLSQHDVSAITDIRLDAMLIVPGKLPQHIPAAFDADG
jgi:putative endonuclease